MITIELRNIPPATMSPWSRLFFGYFISGDAATGGRMVPPVGYGPGAVYFPLYEGVQYQFDYAAIMSAEPTPSSHLSASLYDGTEEAGYLNVDSIPFIPQDNTIYLWYLDTGQVEVKGSTPPPGPSPTLAGKVDAITYWQQGMATPEAVPGAQADRALPLAIYASWKNTGTSDLVGHLDLEITLPGGAVKSFPATQNQDLTASPGSGRTVTFGNIPLTQEGNYQAKVVLTGWEPAAQQPQKLDEKAVSFSAAGVPAPAPDPAPSADYLGPLMSMALLGTLATAIPKLMRGKP